MNRIVKSLAGAPRLVFAILAVCGLALAAAAQENSWLKETSGYWEEPFWSLGSLPSGSHSILFTNTGYKALALGPNTRYFPKSLAISNLTVSSPELSSNTFLLNFLGLDTPLRITDTFLLTSNAVFQCQSSALQVGDIFGGNFLIGGTVRHGDFSQVSARSVYLGYRGRGEYNLTNGWFYANWMDMGELGSPALFNQEGGTNIIDLLFLHPQAEFQVRNGFLFSEFMFLGEGDTVFRRYESTFTQWAGEVSVRGELVVGNHWHGSGTYSLLDGSLSSETLRLGASSEAAGLFLQSGGTNQTGDLILNEGFENPMALPDSYSYSDYFLSAGALLTDRTTIGAGRTANFHQYGGFHLASERVVITAGNERSRYSLSHGFLATPYLTLDSAHFDQTGGTNQVNAALDLRNQSLYTLGGGLLASPNTTIGGSPRLFDPYVFMQTGGCYQISQSLGISSAYGLRGGELRADRLYLSGHFDHLGGSLMVTQSVTFSGAHWLAAATPQLLGPLSLGSDSTLTFSTNPCVLHFASSAAQSWSGLLFLEDWKGALAGGGAQQIIFGNDSSGLSSLQLAQIRFRNPAGLVPGIYPARMLPTGEVLPQPSSFSMAVADHQLVFTWEGPWVLQSATNILGPYLDLPGATSPFSYPLEGVRHKYFRLRSGN